MMPFPTVVHMKAYELERYCWVQNCPFNLTLGHRQLYGQLFTSLTLLSRPMFPLQKAYNIYCGSHAQIVLRLQHLSELQICWSETGENSAPPRCSWIPSQEVYYRYIMASGSQI